MPIEREESEKKPGDDQPAPVSEAILANVSNKGDGTVQAEYAIRSFIRDHLERFHNQMDAAVDQLEAFILSQPAEAAPMFSDRGFFDALGDQFIGQLYGLAGGKGAPLMDRIAGEAYNTVSWAEHAEFQISYFMLHMRRSVRDACWFVRDNSQAILAHQWPQLLDLASGGSFDFVQPLIHLGLPSVKFNPSEFGADLVQFARSWEQKRVPEKEQLAEQAPEQPKKQEEAQQEQQLIQQDSAAQKQAVAV